MGAGGRGGRAGAPGGDDPTEPPALSAAACCWSPLAPGAGGQGPWPPFGGSGGRARARTRAASTLAPGGRPSRAYTSTASTTLCCRAAGEPAGGMDAAVPQPLMCCSSPVASAVAAPPPPSPVLSSLRPVAPAPSGGAWRTPPSPAAASARHARSACCDPGLRGRLRTRPLSVVAKTHPGSGARGVAPGCPSDGPDDAAGEPAAPGPWAAGCGEALPAPVSWSVSSSAWREAWARKNGMAQWCGSAKRSATPTWRTRPYYHYKLLLLTPRQTMTWRHPLPGALQAAALTACVAPGKPSLAKCSKAAACRLMSSCPPAPPALALRGCAPPCRSEGSNGRVTSKEASMGERGVGLHPAVFQLQQGTQPSREVGVAEASRNHPAVCAWTLLPRCLP